MPAVGQLLILGLLTFVYEFGQLTLAASVTTAKDFPKTLSAAAAEASSTATVNDANAVNTRNAAESLMNVCPNMLHYVFEGATPHDEVRAGKFEKFLSATNEEGEVDPKACLIGCCEKNRNETCNVAFVYKNYCYHVRCISNEACLPKERDQVKDMLQMFLVNPVRSANDENLSWLDILKASSKNDLTSIQALDELSSENNAARLSFWNKPHKYRFNSRTQESALPANYDEDDFPLAEKRVKQLLMSSVDDNDNIIPDEIAYYTGGLSADSPTSPLAKFNTCDLEISSPVNRCPAKEECVPIRVNSGTGICKCMRGYTRNQMRECVRQEIDYMQEAAAAIIPVNEPLNDKEDAEISETTKAPEQNNKILVTAESKEVRLPEKEITLSAFTDPLDDTQNPKFKYLWSLISQPKGPMNGTISDQSKAKVKLTNLSEGIYTFKVTVTGDNGANGEAMANVTVLPQKRINKAPQVFISPKEQLIRKPTSNAILDGSTSTDDDKIINYHWDVVSAPIGYQPKLPETATLQLTDLNAPGNYTFKLTVMDSDNVTNFTTANITVLKDTDYPPVANAGKILLKKFIYIINAMQFNNFRGCSNIIFAQ